MFLCWKDYWRPDPNVYTPNWSEGECTHLQMYETTSEGTPISPVMETPEELAQWLVDNEDSAFGEETASYEAWLATIQRGWSSGAIIDSKLGFMSRVEFNLYR